MRYAEIISGRLAGLDVAARGLVEAAAVVGTEVDAGLLGQVGRLAPSAVADAMTAARASGLLTAGLAVLITSLALAFLARCAPTPNPETTDRQTSKAAAWRYCPGRPVPAAPVPDRGAASSSPPGLPRPEQVTMHPHTDACRSSHPGTEAMTPPIAEALSRTAAVPDHRSQRT